MNILAIPLFFAFVLLAGSRPGHAQQPTTARAHEASTQLHFEPIQNAVTPAFLARHASVSVLVDEGGLTLRLPAGREIRCTLVGSSRGTVCASEPTGGASSYFLGSDPSTWRPGVPHYGKVTLRDALPGVEMVCYPAGIHVEFDLALAADVDPASVRLRFDGVEGLRVGSDGQLVVPIGDETLTLRAPITFQQDPLSGERREVASSYRVAASDSANSVEVGFELGAHDTRQPLVIDPIIEFSTLFGGSFDDNVQDVAYDPIHGDTIMVGRTNSADFPFVNSLPQAFTGGHIFVSRFDASGSLVLSTYLGDGGINACVDVDAYGNAIVAGTTWGAHPTTIGALQPTPAGGYDWFVTRLGRNGQLQYSTYAGGTNNDRVVDVKVGLSGYVYLAGSSDGGFPTTPGAYSNSGAGPIVAAIDSGIVYQFSTALAFTGSISALAIDHYFGVWVTGSTNGNDMPTSANAFQTANPGAYSSFVFGLTSNLASRVASTYFGSTGYDGARDLFVRFDQNLAQLYVTIVGTTNSPNLPIQNALQPNYGGSFEDGFVTQFTHLLGGLRFSTYLGGNSTDQMNRIAEDPLHRIHVAGWTQSKDLPMDDAFQGPSYQGPCGYLTRLAPTGDAIEYATYFGGRFAGANIDVAGLALDASHRAIVVGTTRNANWYTTPNAFQPAWSGAGGSTDSFLMRFSNTTAQSYGQGSTTSFYNIVPILSAAGDLTPGSTVALRLQDSSGGSVGVLAFGFGGATSTPLWGGTLLVQPDLLVPFVVGGTFGEQLGHWALNVPLPGGTSFSGIVVRAQAVIGSQAYPAFTPGIELELQ